VPRIQWPRLALSTTTQHAQRLELWGWLSIRFDKKVIALPGEGSPWAVRFKVEASVLRRLPKQLMREEIGVSILESRINLGNYAYRGTPKNSAHRIPKSSNKWGSNLR
jgi:hypothetical protein